MTPTKGRTPRSEGPFMVQFRSGIISGPFKRDQIRWDDTGGSFDVVAAELAEPGAATMTRPANGSYE